MKEKDRQLPRFESGKEIDSRVERYFQQCEGTAVCRESGEPVLDKQNRPVSVGGRTPTLAGLALALGFSRREELLNYPEDGPFAKALRRARLRLEDYLEGELMDKDRFQGAKFNLRNSYGWEDRGPGDREEAAGVVLIPAVEEERDG